MAEYARPATFNGLLGARATVRVAHARAGSCGGDLLPGCGAENRAL